MYYPAFLDLRNRPCLVIGGGSVGERKVKTLLEAGARVKVLSKKVTPGLRSLARKKLIRRVSGENFQNLLGKNFLIVVATNDRSFNRRVSDAARLKKRLVNVVDDAELSNFIVPSTFREGPLQIAVSTGGASPYLAKHIREKIQKEWGKSWGAFLHFIQENRRKVMEHVHDGKLRREILEKMGSEKIRTLLNSGRVQAAKKEVENLIQKWVKKL